MEELEKLKHLMKLKEVDRGDIVGNRKVSSAEHTWGCMILADHFLKVVKEPLDELKVMKLILYHDLVEIEVGDCCLKDTEGRKDKAEKEKTGSRILARKIPDSISEDFIRFFEEYEDGETREAKFAAAIDYLDPIVQWSLHGTDQLKPLGWNEQVIRELKQKYMEPFPELLKFFNEWLAYMKEQGYVE